MLLPLVFRLLLGQRAHLVDILVCALSAVFLEGFFFKLCMEVYLGTIYTPSVFGGAAPSVLSFIGSRYLG